MIDTRFSRQQRDKPDKGKALDEFLTHLTGKYWHDKQLQKRIKDLRVLFPARDETQTKLNT